MNKKSVCVCAVLVLVVVYFVNFSLIRMFALYNFTNPFRKSCTREVYFRVLGSSLLSKPQPILLQ